MSISLRRLTVVALLLAAAGGAWFFVDERPAQAVPSRRALSLPEGQDTSRILVVWPDPVVDMPLLPRREPRAIPPHPPRAARDAHAPRRRPAQLRAPNVPSPPPMSPVAVVPPTLQHEDVEPPLASDGVASPGEELRTLDPP